MALDIDISSPLRSPEELERLVRAVIAAAEHDERHWLEWKTALSDNKREAAAALAKEVLALANRPPELAATACGGLGYVVVGAAPGYLASVEPMDPAMLGDQLERFLGTSTAPFWEPTFLRIDDETVLVVVVEPPCDGDPIRVARQTGPQIINGAAYVRRNTKAEPADAEEMDGLQRRLLAQRRLSVGALDVAVADEPLAWFDLEHTRRAASTEAAERRRKLEAEARRRAQADSGLSGLTGLALDSQRIAVQLGAALGTARDTRDLDDVLAELADWARDLSEVLVSQAVARYMNRHTALRLEVVNPTERFLPGIEIELRIRSAAARFVGEVADEPDLPSAPRPYGEAARPSWFAAPELGVLRRSQFPHPQVAGLPPPVSVDDDGIVAWLNVGDLRAFGRWPATELRLAINDFPDGGDVKVEWTATAYGVDGQLTGTVPVPVMTAATDPMQLWDDVG